MENERLSNILSKNNEIKKLSEESKQYFDKLKEKESEVRRLNL
jgi:hypothetical protein